MEKIESLGWIKIHRSITQWEWYDDINTCRLFIHLLLTANHSYKKWRGIEIKRGQKLTSLSSLSKETKLSIQSVRTSLKRLISTGELTNKSQSKYRLITINNYDEYQESNKQTNKHPTKCQQSANNKQECKNKKNEKNTLKEKIIERWNTISISGSGSNPSVKSNKPIMKKCTKISDTINKLLNDLLKKYKYEDFEKTFISYAKDIAERKESPSGFHEHRFSFQEFLKQSNGFDKFYSQS